MDKLNFEDLPSEKTPINAQNLNQVQTNMENALKQKVNTYLAGENPDIDSIEFRNISGMYGIYSCTKTPTDGIGILSVYCYTPDWVVQEWREPSSRKVWFRSFTSGKSWSGWRLTSEPEIITNENGTAIKFANGQMICYNTILRDIPCSNAWGVLFSGRLTEKILFANTFVEPPTLSVSLNPSSSTGFMVGFEDAFPIENDGFSGVSVVRPNLRDLISVYIHFIAIGRWY